MEPQPVALRDALPGDAPAMAELNVAAWRAFFPGLAPQALLDGMEVEPRVRWWEENLPSVLPVRTWVAERGGRVIGLTHVGPSRDPDAPEAAELYGMYVEPEAVGTGAGRALMAAAFEHFRAGPWEEAILWTLPGDHRAARFYRAWGWQPDGAAKTGSTPLGDIHEVRYRLRLRA
ncbi:MAG TPA: GNAT family N-acetyltransferase [Acidimicrobiia bacterium]|nr:GNAT family N-acetyltransferase [Acidimicrobiia bacterium]